MEIHQNNCRYLLENGTQCPNQQLHDSKFCEQHAQWLPADLEVYRAVTEHYRQDIREFWSRSNFYLLVQSGLLSVFVLIVSQKPVAEKTITIGLGVLGFVIALAWFLVLRGSEVWIRRWREQTIDIDKVVDRHGIYAKTEAYASSSPLTISTNVTQYLPLIFCGGWIAFIFYLLLL